LQNIRYLAILSRLKQWDIHDLRLIRYYYLSWTPKFR